MNCLAPNEDTTYQMSAKLPLDPEHFYAVVGALSTATDNATYVGLGLNSSVKQLGFDNISDEQLAGSATGYSSAVPGHPCVRIIGMAFGWRDLTWMKWMSTPSIFVTNWG